MKVAGMKGMIPDWIQLGCLGYQPASTQPALTQPASRDTASKRPASTQRASTTRRGPETRNAARKRGIVYAFEGMTSTVHAEMPDGLVQMDPASAWRVSRPAFAQLLLDNPHYSDELVHNLSHQERSALYAYIATFGDKPGEIVHPTIRSKPPPSVLALPSGQWEDVPLATHQGEKAFPLMWGQTTWRGWW